MDPQTIEPPRMDAQGRQNPPPRYPKLSRRLREEGTVILKIRILRDGRVGAIEIERSSGHARLDRAAMQAVAKWRYIPARQGGEAIEYNYLQPVEFTLR